MPYMPGLEEFKAYAQRMRRLSEEMQLKLQLNPTQEV